MPRTKVALWGGPGLRFFISHSHVDKVTAAELKEQLENLGAQAFVAHEDIKPTSQWQDEMLDALGSMDVLVAVLTKDFRRSKWTDQEVGYAISSSVPVIPIRMSVSPYGFMSDVQALRRNDSAEKWAKTLVEYAFESDDLASPCFRTILTATKNCPNYKAADVLLREVLPMFRHWTPRRARRFVRAYNESQQVYDSVRYRGQGFLTALNDQTGGQFSVGKDYKLKWSQP
ncbi:MAG: toll/interleukin-1 receptor domain-containing protein [Acidimicrobiaceae bacterium]|nr:toll/interleukin-1 receptor domain-containing protein [Acidimicrobiaceae bacterium]